MQRASGGMQDWHEPARTDSYTNTCLSQSQNKVQSQALTPHSAVRHRQQEVYTRAFVGRIERLLLAHPRFHKRFTACLKECNVSLRSAHLAGKFNAQ